MKSNIYEKISNGQILRGPDLLKTLPPQTTLFDSFSSSDSSASGFSAPFSDVIYSVEVESKKKEKELYGKNLYTAFSFSSEFILAIEDVKKELIKQNPDYSKTDSLVGENLEKIKSGSLCPSKLEENQSFKEFKFLQFPHIDYEVEENENDNEGKKKHKEGKDKIKVKNIWHDDDSVSFDTMSGYWRLLSVFDEFKISSPWFDAYAEGKKHWLETNPILENVIETSRKKCLHWLNKYFEN